MLLNGKVVLVTGGGRGIGAAISRVLAGEGAAVAINYSASRERAEQLARQISEGGGKARAFAADDLRRRPSDAAPRRRDQCNASLESHGPGV